jgi:hypothetical protein
MTTPVLQLDGKKMTWVKPQAEVAVFLFKIFFTLNGLFFYLGGGCQEAPNRWGFSRQQAVIFSLWHR